MPDVTIGDNVVIGAHGLVTSDIASSSVAVGNPAKVICTIEEHMEKLPSEQAFFPDYKVGDCIQHEQILEFRKKVYSKIHP